VLNKASEGAGADAQLRRGLVLNKASEGAGADAQLRRGLALNKASEGAGADMRIIFILAIESIFSIPTKIFIKSIRLLSTLYLL